MFRRRAPKRGIDLLAVTGAVTRFRRRRRWRGAAVAALLGMAALGVSSLVSPSPRLVWNASASAPIGLYWVEPNMPIRRGDLVLATLPETMRWLAADRAYLPSNVPLVKRIEALSGDTICAVGEDIFVNGRKVAQRLKADGQGRVLPVWQGCRLLVSNEVFLLMEGVPDSFDGRYFGAVETRNIVGRLVPLWTR